MADKNKAKAKRLVRRKHAVRSNLFGSPERPRLSVFRSDKHIYAQLIDDFAGKTLASASTTLGDVRGEREGIAARDGVGLQPRGRRDVADADHLRSREAARAERSQRGGPKVCPAPVRP